MANATNIQGGLIPLRFSGGAPVDNRKCEGKHSVYVAEVVYIQKDGVLWVINVCKACGVVSFHPKQIASPTAPAEFLKDKEKEQDHEF
jgi:hypothetical protein